MTTSMIARFGDWYDALSWRDQSLLGLGLIVVTAAIVFLAVQLFAYVMVRSLRREIREPWALAPIPRRECETYCRSCRAYKVTAETYCEICSAPLLLFADALDMSAHMARTFPLPAVKKDQPALVAYRGGRLQ